MNQEYSRNDAISTGTTRVIVCLYPLVSLASGIIGFYGIPKLRMFNAVVLGRFLGESQAWAPNWEPFSGWQYVVYRHPILCLALPAAHVILVLSRLGSSRGGCPGDVVGLLIAILAVSVPLVAMVMPYAASDSLYAALRA